MVTVRFERISAGRIGVATFCRRCKKKLKRTVREEQTQNPWNRITVDGVNRPKRGDEIWRECEAEVKRRVAVLQSEGTLCGACKELGTPATPGECVA